MKALFDVSKEYQIDDEFELKIITRLDQMGIAQKLEDNQIGPLARWIGYNIEHAKPADPAYPHDFLDEVDPQVIEEETTIYRFTYEDYAARAAALYKKIGQVVLEAGESPALRELIALREKMAVMRMEKELATLNDRGNCDPDSTFPHQYLLDLTSQLARETKRMAALHNAPDQLINSLTEFVNLAWVMLVNAGLVGHDDPQATATETVSENVRQSIRAIYELDEANCKYTREHYEELRALESEGKLHAAAWSYTT